jgi:hypothetical protein
VIASLWLDLSPRMALRMIPRMALLLALISTPALHAQAADPSSPSPGVQMPGSAASQDGPEDEARRKLLRDQLKKANEERFQKVKEDTEKLVRLSNELKEYVGKANEHTLSLDVIKKAEEIEKLAKSVKEKMKG